MDNHIDLQTDEPSISLREGQRDLVGYSRLLFLLLCLSLGLFHLYTAGLRPLTALFQRSIHLALVLSLVFLLYKPSKRGGDTFWGRMLDYLMVILSMITSVYIITNFEEIIFRIGFWSRSDIVFGIITILLVLEASRRVIGLNLTVIGLFFIVYAFLGPHLPGFFRHRGFGMSRLVGQLYLTTEGIFGIPIGVAATFIYIFILFGSFLEKSGGGDFFIELAYSLAGTMRGGAAKAAVIASGLMGSVSGSAVANVVTTGSFTIPLMKRMGYKPHVAAGIEAAASTGGQMMPPIMGAGAFLMAELTNTPYLYIIGISLIPAIMYYVSVLLFVHFEACKEDIQPMLRKDLPELKTVLIKGFPFLLPVAVLVYALVQNYSPMRAGFLAIIVLFLVSLLRKFTRMSWKVFLEAFSQAARNMMIVTVACAVAGIIMGVVGLTGLGLKFSSLVLAASGGITLLALIFIALASLVLGMGLPVTASYIIIAVLAGPALLEMGIPLIVAHMIIFWYSQDANITPPVALAAYAGAGVAGSEVMKTALVSWKVGKGIYIIPIMMAYTPVLLNGPPWEVFQAVVSGTLGLVALVSAMQRYFFRPARYYEIIMVATAGVLLLWPSFFTNFIGLLIFSLYILLQYHFTYEASIFSRLSINKRVNK